MFDLPENGGSFLEHRSSGRKTKIYPRDGVFVLPVWFKKQPTQALLTAQLEEQKSSGGDPFLRQPMKA